MQHATVTIEYDEETGTVHGSVDCSHPEGSAISALADVVVQALKAELNGAEQHNSTITLQ